MRRDLKMRLAALAAAPLLLVLQGCLLDIRAGTMNDPGTPVDTQADEPVVETEIDDDFVIPDLDVPDDVGPCDISCEDGWTPACQGTTVWCVSPYMGEASCCDAFEACQGLGGAFPGFWPTAGPYDYIPPDFDSYMDLPGITIVYSGWSEPYITANISCFNANGTKDKGETHIFSTSGDCATSPPTYSCLLWSQSTVCTGDYIGCRWDCTYPFWCVSN
jgi:hypothetical protein